MLLALVRMLHGFYMYGVNYSLILFAFSYTHCDASSLSNSTSDHHPSRRALLKCVKCLGNETTCQDTCVGYYCYKFEMLGRSKNPVKRGCLNETGPLSKVNECSLRNHEIGRLVIVEDFCICTKHLCNSCANTEPRMYILHDVERQILEPLDSQECERGRK
ncbi:hypothetical protein Q1695_000020 [Nippostrongylus brasiliensis]|nr:hypothetical protein Q1695_000020 [Nippostrongylus brasiliensis]